MPTIEPQDISLQQILAAVEEGIVAADGGGVCTYANPAAARILGLAGEELLGSDLVQLLHDVLAHSPMPPPHEALAFVLSGGPEVRFSGCNLVRRNGPPRLVDVRIAPLIEEGRQAGALLTFYNLDLRHRVPERRSDEELLRNEASLRGIVAQLVIWAMDLDGICTLSDGRGLQALGLQSGESVGKSILTLYADFPDVVASARRALAGEEFTATHEVHGIIFDTRYSPLHDRSGKLIGTLGIATDITERVRAEQAMLRVADQRRRTAVLDERNRIAREIHDTLAQGFTGIVVHLEAAEAAHGVKPEESVRLMLRARELARNSLTEARRSVWALRPTVLDGVDLATALPRLAKQLLGAAGVIVEFRTAGAPADIQPDVEENLLRIAQESLNNTLHHAAASRVEMELAFEEKWLKLRVRDDGRGFDSAARIAGRGFGLISMHERAEQIGADLTITSRVDGGTEVLVVVPR